MGKLHTFNHVQQMSLQEHRHHRTLASHFSLVSACMRIISLPDSWHSNPKIDRAGPGKIMRHILSQYSCILYIFLKMSVFSVFPSIPCVCTSFENWKKHKNLIHAPVPRRGCVEPVQVLVLSDWFSSQSRSLVTKI